MKIENRGISITEVPRVWSIVAESDTVSIHLENSGASWVWTFPELREFHEAIGEALKHDPESSVVSVKPEKTEWHEGDPEPEGVTEIIDCDGDLWSRLQPGWWVMGGEEIGFCRSWNDLLGIWGPLRLPEDAE